MTISKKKAIIVLFLIIVIAIIAAVYLNRDSKSVEEENFIICRTDCIYNTKEKPYEGAPLQYYFVSTDENSKLFNLEHIFKTEIQDDSGEAICYCEVEKDKEFDVFPCECNGKKYYLKPVIIDVYTTISDETTENCKMFISYENGNYYVLKCGSVSSLHDELEADTSKYDVLLMGAYGKDGDAYNTYGVYIGIKPKENMEITDMRTTCPGYEPVLSNTIAEKMLCKDFDYENVSNNYPEAIFNGEKNTKNKSIKLEANQEYVLIIPFSSKFEIPLGTYAQTMKVNYAEKKEELFFDFGSVLDVVGITEDYLMQMERYSNNE